MWCCSAQKYTVVAIRINIPMKVNQFELTICASAANKFTEILSNKVLEGTVSRDFWAFFLLKIFDLGPIWTDENGFANLFIFAKIFAKNVCPRSRWLRGHPIFKRCNRISSPKRKISRNNFCRLYGALVESFNPKKMVENIVTLSL